MSAPTAVAPARADEAKPVRPAHAAARPVRPAHASAAARPRPWRRFRVWARDSDALWLGGFLAAAAAVLAVLLPYPGPTAAVLAVGFVAWRGWVAGPERSVGVGVCGALLVVSFVPPLHTALPGWLGPAAGSVWLLAFAFRRPFLPPWRTGAWTLVALLLLGMLAGVLWWEVTVSRLALAVAGFLVLLTLGAGKANAAERRWILATLAFVGVVAALACSLETFVLRRTLFPPEEGEDPRIHPLLEGTVRGEATFGHPLVAGFAMLVAFGVVLTARNRWFVKAPLLALLAVGILACGSTSVYAAAVVVGGLWLVTAVHRRWVTVWMGLAVGTGVWIYFNQHLFEPVSADVSGTNAAHRLNSLVGMPRLVELRPPGQALLGTGWGSEKFNYGNDYLINDNFFAVDNQFASVLMSAGAFGLLLFVGGLAWILVHAERRMLPLLGGALMMFASFDVLLWATTGAALVVLLSISSAAPRPGGRGASRAERADALARVDAPARARSAAALRRRAAADRVAARAGLRRPGVFPRWRLPDGRFPVRPAEDPCFDTQGMRRPGVFPRGIFAAWYPAPAGEDQWADTEGMRVAGVFPRRRFPERDFPVPRGAAGPARAKPGPAPRRASPPDDAVFAYPLRPLVGLRAARANARTRRRGRHAGPKVPAAQPDVVPDALPVE